MAEMQRLGPLLAGWNRRATGTSSGSDAEELTRDESLWTVEGSADCEVCGGAGYLRLSRPIGDPDFGRVQPCECRRAEHDTLTAARLQRLSNLGPLSDSRISAEESEREPVASACAFADGSDGEPGCLLLIGAAGTGRTRLSAEMANRRIADGRSALYFVTADLLDRLRSAMNAPTGGDFSYALLFEHVRDAPFLILDDLDCISPTDWAREKLFQLLNHRRNSSRRTVLVSETADLSPIGLQSFVTMDVAQVELGGAATERRFREFGGMSENVLSQYTFDSFREQGLGGRGDAGNLAWVKDQVLNWAKNPGGWLTLYGAPGVGKSHLAAATANERLLAGNSVCFAVVSELLDELRSSFRDSDEGLFEETFRWLKEVDFLVLDDLAAQKESEWVTEKLYQLLSFRHLQRLPTMIVMNIIPDELDPRLASRVMDSKVGVYLHVRGMDYRTKRKTVEVKRTNRGFRPRG